MATSNQIRRGIGFIGRFATGAGAFDSIGRGSKLVDTAKNIATGGNVQAGAGVSLGDRLRSGLTAASPTFAKAENIRSQIQSRGVSTQINQNTIQQFRKDQEIIPMDQVTSGLGVTASNFIKEKLERQGVFVTEGGVSGVRRGDGRKVLAPMMDEPHEKLELIQMDISDNKGKQERVNQSRERVIEDLIQAEFKKAGIKETPGNKLEGKRAEIRKMIESGVIVSSELQGFDGELGVLTDEQKQLSGIADGFQQEVDDSRASPLQESQIALNEAKTKAVLDPSDGSFDAGTYAKLANSDNPAERKLAEDALKFKRKPEGEARRDIVFSTIAKSLVGEEGLQRRAQKSAGSIPRLEKMIQLAETGKVTGQGGKIKSGLAGWAELIGVSEESLKSQGYSDSQLFQQLGRLIVGPLRTEIIGPGQVTDNEQNILVKAGGAGGLTKGAAIELLQEYITQNQDNINFYNENVSSLLELDKEAGRAFKHIQSGDRRRGQVGKVSPSKTAQDFFDAGGK